MELHVQSFGARLRTRGEIFVLTTPDLTGAGKDVVHELAPHQVKQILLYKKGGSVSADALALALQNDIDIVLCDELSNPLGRVWSNEPTNSLAIQAAQFRLIGAPRSMDFVKEWISRKFWRKMAFLERLESFREGEKLEMLQTTRRQIGEYHARLQNVPTHDVPKASASIRGYGLHTTLPRL